MSSKSLETLASVSQGIRELAKRNDTEALKNIRSKVTWWSD